ncbi:MAG: hypothetical protein AAFN77_03045 [Planctomycetota bacterium]
MDPNETWNQLLEAYYDSDSERVIELSEAMLRWLRRGGFGPGLVVGSPDGSTLVEMASSFDTRAISESVARNLLADANKRISAR